MRGRPGANSTCTTSPVPIIMSMNHWQLNAFKFKLPAAGPYYHTRTTVTSFKFKLIRRVVLPQPEECCLCPGGICYGGP